MPGPYDNFCRKVNGIDTNDVFLATGKAYLGNKPGKESVLRRVVLLWRLESSPILSKTLVTFSVIQQLISLFFALSIRQIHALSQ